MRFDDTTGFLLLGGSNTKKEKEKTNPIVTKLAENTEEQLKKLEELVKINKQAQKKQASDERLEKVEAPKAKNNTTHLDTQKLEKAVDVLGEQYTAGAKEIQSGFMSIKDRFLTPLKWLSWLKPKKKATNASEKVHHTPYKKEDIYKAKKDDNNNSKTNILFGGGVKGLIGKMLASALGGFGLKKLLGAVFSKAFLKGILKKGFIVASALSLVNSISDGMARVRKYLGLSSTDETTIANKLAGITTGIVNGVSSLLNIISFGLIPKLNEDNVAKTVTDKFNSIAEDINVALDNLTENAPIVGNSAKKLLDVVNEGMSKVGEGWEKLSLETEDIFTQASDLFRKQSEAEKAWKKANKKWWEWDWKPDFMKSKEEKDKELKDKAEKAKAVMKDKGWLKHASKKDKLEAQNAINTYNTVEVNKKVKKNNEVIRKKKDGLANTKKYLAESKARLKELKQKYSNTTDPKEKKKLKLQIDAYELSVKNLTTNMDTLQKGIKDLIDANMKLIEGLKDVKINTDNNSNKTSGSDGFIPSKGGKAIAGVQNGQRFVQYSNGEKKIGGHRNWRNNNPGNIEYGKFAKSHGAIGTDGRFAIFPSMEVGYKAQADLLSTKRYKSKTLAQAINMYAPSFENDTNSYINSVSKATGIPPNTPMSSLSKEQLVRVTKAMSVHEGMKRGKVEHTATNVIKNSSKKEDTQTKAENNVSIKTTKLKEKHQEGGRVHTNNAKRVKSTKKVKPTSKLSKPSIKKDTSKKSEKEASSTPKVVVHNDNKEVVEAISELHKTITKQGKQNIKKDNGTKKDDSTIIHKPLKLSLKDKE